MAEFPKKVKAYLHADKDSMYQLGTEIELTEEGLVNFKWAMHEVVLSLLVQEDGTYEILGVIEG